MRIAILILASGLAACSREPDASVAGMRPAAGDVSMLAAERAQRDIDAYAAANPDGVARQALKQTTAKNALAGTHLKH